MSTKKAIVVRSTKAQISYLCAYMREHPSLAVGGDPRHTNAKLVKQQWEQLKCSLNKLGHHRTVEQWKICWRDQKRKAREKGVNLLDSHSETANTEDFSELTPNMLMMLDSNGEKMTVECDPEDTTVSTSEELQKLWRELKKQRKDKTRRHSLPSTSAIEVSVEPVYLEDSDIDMKPDMTIDSPQQSPKSLTHESCPDPLSEPILVSPNLSTSSSNTFESLRVAILEREYKERQRRANEAHELELAFLKERLRLAKAKADMAELELQRKQQSMNT